MKKQTSNKKLLWILLAVVLVVAAVAVAVVLSLLGGSEKEPATEPPVTTQAPTETSEDTQPQEQEMKLYWNVDGATYRGTDFVRVVNSEDGFVYIQFAVEGEQVRLPVADRTLAQKIDMMKLMGLVFDSNGVVVDALRVEDFTGGLAANEYYVTAIDGNTYTCNSASTYDGFDVKFTVDENTKVWNVGGEGLMVGLPGVVALEDQVIAVKDLEGNITDIFVIPYELPGDVYWNITRMYDSTAGTTTRGRDATGYFTMEVVYRGEVMTLRTTDQAIMSKMDAQVARCFGLDIDENGNITEVYHAGTYTGGGSCASWYHCTAIDGEEASFLKLSDTSKGSTYTGQIYKDCKIYDVSSSAEPMGATTTLKVGDQVHCLRDSRGRICTIFIINRAADSEMYWNVERMYDSTTKLTTRTPDADGWYRITVAVRGEQMVVKTQDPDIVQKIDARAAMCFGLKLNGDVIEKFYTPDAVTVGGTWASWYDVTEFDGKNLTVHKDGTGDIKKGTLAADCQIYNVSANAKLVGQVDQLQVGDRIHSLQNINGEVCVIFIVNRYEDLPVYYNYTRKYDSNLKQTTRTPDAEGYYVFEMAHNGKTVTVKTKDKSVATDIDSQVAKCLAMEVYNGIVYRAMHPSNCIKTRGGPTSSYTYVTSVSQYGFKTEKIENSKVTKTYDETFAAGCKIYNVSTNFVTERGEPTTLSVGDFVHCLKDKEGNVCYVFIMEHFEDLGVYYNLVRKYSSTTEETTRTPDANGVYTFEMAHDGQKVTVKTKDKAVATAIDFEVAKVVGIGFDKDGYAIKAVHAKSTKECKGGIGVSYATVVSIEGDQVTTYKSDTDTTTTFTLAENANIFNVGTKHLVSHQGERTKLQVGDFIHCLKGDGGKTSYVYVMSRVATFEKGQHTCDHVTDNVTWYAWDGTQAPETSGYYYLTQDAVYSAGRITVAKGVEITICLNGHTLTSEDRFFNVYGTLNICDHKENKGKLVSSLSSTVDGDGKITTNAYGGLFYMYNSGNTNPVLNIYGGTLEHTGKVTTGGIGYLGNSSEDNAGVATMNLYGGTIRGGQSYTVGAGLQVSHHSVFNMYGGTITGCVATGNGGGVNVDSGTFNMEGGTLTGNTGAEGGNLRTGRTGVANISGKAVITQGTGKNGGNITNQGTLNISGGTINAPTGTGNASSILSYANLANVTAKINITGGTLGGNIRIGANQGTVDLSIADAAWNGNINVTTGAVTLTVGGKVQLTRVNLADSKVIGISEKGLDDSSKIAISMDNDVPAFAAITDSKDEACFVPVNTSIYKIVNKDNLLYLVPTVLHEHCICGGNAADLGGHTACDSFRWTPWTESESLPTSGSIVLTTDVTLTEPVTIAKGGTLSVCLNGHTITSTNRVFRVNGNLNITDCQKNPDGTFVGSIESSYSNSVDGDGDPVKTYGAIAYLYNDTGKNPVLNIYGGNLVYTGTGTQTAGVLFLGNKTDDESGNCTLNMYGGTVSGGISLTSGGNLYLSHTSTFNMYGGTITGGQAETGGGNISVLDNSIFNMYGGTVTDGAAGTNGGNIYLSKGTVTLSGGTVENGTALHSYQDGSSTVKGSGGNIYIAKNSVNALTLSGTEVLGGEGLGSGGSINIEKGTATMTAGLVSGGKTGSEGGNIRVGSDAELTVSGNAVIEKGTATTGGNLAVFGTLNMNGGTVRDGVITGQGGNISAFANLASVHVVLNIKGATITGGTVRMGANNGTIDATFTDSTVDSQINVQSTNVRLTLSGKVTLEELKLNTGCSVAIAADGLDDSSAIRVNAPAEQVFATITDANDEACFVPTDTELYKVQNADNALSLVSNLPEHNHCVCGDGTMNGKHGHACDANVEWAPWSEIGSLPTEGNYYLTDDVNVAGNRTTISGGATLNLCLNGCTITGTNRIFIVNGGKLVLTDCAETAGTVQSSYSGVVVNQSGGFTNNYAPIFYLYTSAADSYMDMYRVNLTSIATDPIAVAGIGKIGNSGTKEAIFNMYSGTISGGKGHKGGGISVDCYGVFNMYGGKITDCQTFVYEDDKNQNGAAVYVNAFASFNMYGGEISGCTSSNAGSAIMITGEASKNHASSATIDGGKITGNTGNQAVYVGSVGSLTLTGNTYISGNTTAGGTASNVYLSKDGATITVRDLADTALIGIGMKTPGVFATVTDQNDAACFQSDKTTYQVENVSGELSLKAPVVSTTHIHCICAGKAPGMEGHSCDPATEWIAWGNDEAEWTSLPTSGNYYLTHDVTLTAPISIADGKQLSICLNGFNITGEDRVFKITGELNVTNCDDTKGTITGNTASKQTNGGVFYIYKTGTGVFNLFAGTLTGQVSGSGGIGCTGSDNSGTATFNMYGGQLLNGQAGTNGGAIVMWNGSDVNIYGGEITGGQAANGGNISVVTGTLTVAGGTISGGSATTAGDNVLISGSQKLVITGGQITGGVEGTTASANVTVGGNAQITGGANGNLILKSGQIVNIHADGLEDTAQIGITGIVGEVFATVTDANDAACFVSDSGDYQVKNENGSLSLAENTAHTHCLCNGTAVGKGSHLCENVTFEAWSTPGSLPASGSIYLTTDVTLSQVLEIAANTELSICLNGHNITAPQRVFNIKGPLNLTNCDTTKGTVTGNTEGTQANAGAFYVYNNAAFNLFAGNVTAAKAVTSTGGVGAVAGGTNGVMNMYGGQIFGGRVPNGKYAGNLIIWDGATLNLYGGVIADGQAHGGGNVAIDKGTFNMYGGEVKDGKAVNTDAAKATYGGNIRVSENATFNLYGGIISGGQAKTGGGNVYGNNNSTVYAQIHISGGTITGGVLTDSAKQNNGAGFLNYGQSYISGDPVISGNQGSNVASSSFVIENGGMTEGAKVFVYRAAADAVVAKTALSEADANYFFCDVIDFDVVYDSGKLVTAAAAHRHCICNGTDAEHEHFESVKWTAWGEEASEKTSLPASGTYYLTDDVQLSDALTIAVNTELTLCLNGHTITSKQDGTARVFSIKGTLNLVDCQTNPDGTYKGNVNSYYASTSTTKRYGGVFYMYNSPNTTTFNLYGGNLVSLATDSVYEGGIGYVGNSDPGTCVFNMYAGTISGGKAAQNGGNLNVINSCKFNLYGGTVSGGNAAGSGGNLNVDNGCKVNLYGGTVTGGYCAKENGNIRVAGGGEVTIGGTAVVENGSATNGGNIGVYGTLNIEGEATIRNGTARGSDGNGGVGANISAYANASTSHPVINMTGGEISGGSAKYAAAIRAEGADGQVEVNITGGTVSSGTVTVGYPCILVGTPKAGSATGSIDMTIGGTANIDQIYTKGASQIHISSETPFAQETEIVLGYGSDYTTYKTGVVVTNVTDTEVAKYFTPISAAWELVYDEDEDTLTIQEKA